MNKDRFSEWGTKYVFQDVLEILAGKSLTAQGCSPEEAIHRTEYVLGYFIKIVERAQKGVILENTDSFFVGPENAMNWYATQSFDKYLKDSMPDWRKDLSLLADTLQKFKEGREIEEDARKKTIQIFSEILELLPINPSPPVFRNRHHLAA